MITPTVVEMDVRTVNQKVEAIRFADDYQNGFAGACHVVNEPGAGAISIKNEGYSRVTITSIQHARDLITALEKAIKLGWVK